jgi:hypothetical protein
MPFSVGLATKFAEAQRNAEAQDGCDPDLVIHRGQEEEGLCQSSPLPIRRGAMKTAAVGSQLFYNHQTLCCGTGEE